jgi:BlaI family penicillinase repressor
MENEKINITESEWKVMQVVWHTPYLTLGEIKKRMDETVVWDKTTINTLLRRLKNKGAIGAKQARYSQYYALVSEEECLLEEMDSILKRFFYSSPKKLMSTLVKHEQFSDEDLSELETLLSEIREKNK